MAGNIFGGIITLTTFGESHGNAIGGVLDGMPARVKIDQNLIQDELDKRRPGQSSLMSSRRESDKVEFLSGIFEGYSLGTPIAFIIKNTDSNPADYEHLKKVYRPSHADFTYDIKYGIRDYRGGGRASARETVARVVGGALVKQFLGLSNISITAYVNRIGTINIDKHYTELNLDTIEASSVRCPDTKVSDLMISEIQRVAKLGDTLGGEITCVIKNAPPALGEPVFNKLNADLAHAIMSINAVKGFEIGAGFSSAQMMGSEHNDIFIKKDDDIHTATNNSGGIQGGISNGEDIYFRVAFKPVATLMKQQQTVDTQGKKVIMEGKGRHDVTVVPRAVPIVESMAALVIADHLLMTKTTKL